MLLIPESLCKWYCVHIHVCTGACAFEYTCVPVYEDQESCFLSDSPPYALSRVPHWTSLSSLIRLDLLMRSRSSQCRDNRCTAQRDYILCEVYSSRLGTPQPHSKHFTSDAIPINEFLARTGLIMLEVLSLILAEGQPIRNKRILHRTWNSENEGGSFNKNIHHMLGYLNAWSSKWRYLKRNGRCVSLLEWVWSCCRKCITVWEGFEVLLLLV